MFRSSRMAGRVPLLVSCKELRSLLSTPNNNVRLLDATWFMPNSPRNPLAEHAKSRLPAAAFWDVDRIASDHPLGLKHMLPHAAQFSRACSEFGLKPDSHIVVYDTHGVFSSARTLFTFRAFGHDRSSVLNGGLPAWEAEGYDLETSEPSDPPKQSDYKLDPSIDGQSAIKDYDYMVKNAKLKPDDGAANLVLDARPSGRFTGKDPEPRPGLSSGHMPHSLSLTFNRLLQQHTNPKTGKQYTTMLDPPELEKVFRQVLGDKNYEAVLAGKQSITNTCGSGMTAAVIWLALQTLGVQSSIYDESWTGYASRPESEIVKDDE